MSSKWCIAESGYCLYILSEGRLKKVFWVKTKKLQWEKHCHGKNHFGNRT